MLRFLFVIGIILFMFGLLGYIVNTILDKFKRKAPQLRNNITDHDVISFALQKGGITTPTALCLHLHISIDDAKTKLDELHDKGIFEMQVGEKGSLQYLLIDADALRI